MTSAPLASKTVVVTGAGSGLGRTTALLCAEAGADELVGVDLRGVALRLNHEIRQLKSQGRGGSIVNIGSTRSFRATASAYTASKQTVVGLTESAALSAGHHDIRANALCPGLMATPLVSQLLAGSPTTEAEYVAQVGGPLGRIGGPDEVAQAAVWLCSDLSSHVTAHSLVADGDYLAR